VAFFPPCLHFSFISPSNPQLEPPVAPPFQDEMAPRLLPDSLPAFPPQHRLVDVDDALSVSPSYFWDVFRRTALDSLDLFRYIVSMALCVRRDSFFPAMGTLSLSFCVFRAGLFPFSLKDSFSRPYPTTEQSAPSLIFSYSFL